MSWINSLSVCVMLLYENIDDVITNWMQAKAFRSTEFDDEDSDDDFSDDEELQSPIDDVDPFIFFVDTIKGKLLLFMLYSSQILSCMVS